MKAILFDLDDTLLVDEASNRDAMAAAARAARDAHGVDAGRFEAAAEAAARALFAAGPARAFCERIGISPHECLWGDFSGPGEETKTLRRWLPGFRSGVFGAALREFLIVVDDEEAAALCGAFASARRKQNILLPDAAETLLRLKADHRLGLVTNGDPGLQRMKLAASGLAPLFDTVVVSGEFGTGKPEAAIFHAALDELGVPPAKAAMVGNSLARDIAGAKAAGLAHAIWIEVPGAEEFAETTPDATIRGLHELPRILAGQAS